MKKTKLLILALITLSASMLGQSDSRAYLFTGVVYDLNFRPLAYTHVIAEGTRQGDMTDTLGVFSLYILENDRLHFYNIAFQDTIVEVRSADEFFYIKMQAKIYALKEARIFDWGSSYGDFKEDLMKRAKEPTLGQQVGLPQQAPGLIPFEMNERLLKSPKFFFASPLSYLYFNYSKREKSARKAFKLEQNKERIKEFEKLVSPENLEAMTGLEGEEQKAFILYLNAQLICDYTCTEIDILTEVYKIWEQYKLLSE